MADTVLLQVRVSAMLVKRIDELCRDGIFRNRGEVVSEALRNLILRYTRASSEARMTAMYLSGRLHKGVNPETLVFDVSRPYSMPEED
ncbi:MAG: ribbon-helix-helix domain-containing protein [Aigarchaeota archaeon]|nr:ribbon-helix-helix domain-containing protein [Aigarchaeota archaeon]MDW8092776.1 ribbon-helix-helix domain-containing protein [Nitrososphaerota archaeon]